MSHEAPSRRSGLHRFLIASLLPLLAAAAMAAEPPLLRPAPQDPRSKISSAILRHLAQPADSRLLSRAVTGSAPGAIIMRLDAVPDAATLAKITASGVRVLRSSARWREVQVEATPDQAVALSRLTEIHRIAPAWRPLLRSIPVNDQADAVIRTDALRTAYGATGAGLTLGIISDSFNLSTAVGHGTVTGTPPTATLTGTIPQLSGDLPASITLVDPGSAASGNTDEGAAMMEESFKLAPGSAYAFASAGATETDMADNIAALGTAGCKVICDDIGFLTEPMFQDGPVAQAADAFVASGGIYFSAAGNSADGGILVPYADVALAADPHGSKPDGSDFHDWGIGGSTPGFLPITITPHQGATATLTVVLQWDQPFESNGLGAGSQSDYDLYLFKGTTVHSRLIDFSVDSQGDTGLPSGDPWEIIQDQFSSTTTVYLAVDRFQGGAANLRLVLDVSRGDLTFPRPPTGYPAGTIYGHPAAAKALAIAAVPFSTPGTLETFSSKGGWGASGLPFYFDATGNALGGAPQRRDKPELTAPDGVASSLADFNPFYGTSGAVPHAAATAALLWTIFPGLTNQELSDLLTGSAVDITTAPASAGADAWSGHGLIDAVAAATAAGPDIVTTLGATPSSSTQILIQVTFATPVTVSGVPTLALNTTPGRSATYSTGSGTSTLVFSYDIVAGDSAAGALDAAGTSALALAGGSITDADGSMARLTLPIGASAGSLASADVHLPSLAITATPTISNLPTFACTFTFSEAVSGFAGGAITVGNGSLSAFAGSGSTYTATVTATAPGTVTVTVPVGAATNAGGYPSFSASTSMVYDTTPPTVILGAPATARSGSHVPVTFTFDNPVTGFDQTSVAVVGGQVASFSGSGAAYTLTLTAGAPGIMSVTVTSTTVTDLAGNALASGDSVAVTITKKPASGGGGGGGGCGIGGIGLMILASGLLLRQRRRRV